MQEVKEVKEICQYRLRAIDLWARLMNREVDEDLIEHFSSYSTNDILKPFLKQLKEKFSFGEIAIKYGLPASTAKYLFYNSLAA